MSIEAMKLALEALESCCGTNADERLPGGAITALRTALAQQPATGKPSPTHGINLGERIKHVGGRENAQGYIEFGSVMAVSALIKQVIRDMRPPSPSVPDDSKRLDYLQDRGATIDLIAGVAAFYPMRFRVCGLDSSANIDVRAAIDAAMLAAKKRSA